MCCQSDVIEDVCPEGRAGLTSNRTEGVNPSYDGGNLEHWYTLAQDFVNTVKKENLPYGMYISNLPYGMYISMMCTLHSEFISIH